MDANELNLPPPYCQERLPLLIEVLPEFAVADAPPAPRRRVWTTAFVSIAFIATCASTFAAGVFGVAHYQPGSHAAIVDGLMYSLAVMTILLCHEMGHFIQALRYGVRAMGPFFIPMPVTPIGTLGAVIVMEPRRGNLRAVFDIGISGPLAGLVPTILFLCLGLSWSHCKLPEPGEYVFGAPLLAQVLFTWMHGPIPTGLCIAYHPLAFAGWVGLLITSINLMPIGQLDGGHILHGMFPRRSHVASVVFLVAAIYLSIRFWLPGWWLMLGLISFLGTRHPPTADDSVPLGAGRFALGLATLAFVIIGFTPMPIRLS
jgi:membrane-associated protease RseP (regulator of RpoE activity)